MAEATLLTRVRELEARIEAIEGGYSPAPDLVCNVLAFGADRSGATETRQAFADAVAAIAAAGKGKLYVPDGTYLLDCDSYANAINLPSNCHLEMAVGAVIQLAALDAGDNNHAVFRINGADNVHVSGGTIIGQRTGPSSGENGFAFYVTGGSSNVLIENVNIRDMWGDGIYIGGTQDSYITVRNCRIENCRRQGISIINAQHVLLEGNTLYNINGTAPQCGIDIEPNSGQSVEDVRIIGNLAQECAGGGIKIQALASAGDRYTRQVVVTGNVVRCPDVTGISFWGAGCTDCIASDNAIYDTTYGIYVDNYPVRLTVVGNHIYNAATGLWLSGPQHSVFANNNIYSPSSFGIRARAEDTQYFQGNNVSHNNVFTPGGNGLDIAARYCDISHNTVYSAIGHGLYLNSCLGCNIVGNTLIGCGTDGTSAALNIFSCVGCQVTDTLIRALGITAQGIALNAAAANNIVRNNDIFDLAAAAAVVDSGTGTVTTSGNRTA